MALLVPASCVGGPAANGEAGPPGDSLAKQDRLQEAIVVVNELVSSIASVHSLEECLANLQMSGYIFVGHRGPIWCLLGGGDYLYSASGDKSVKMWQTLSLLALVCGFLLVWEALEERLSLLLAPLNALGSASAIAAVETDGEHSNDEAAVSSSAVTSTEEVASATTRPSHVLRGHSSQVSCLSVMRTSAGLKLLSGSHDMSVAVWSLHKYAAHSKLCNGIKAL
uniref:WD_REPEATS_REGION domain-containing protein n=1 Tax=Macrostomum lignano TaxID=282301 RepID=A0A1I8F9V0_9PLAT